VLIHNQTDLQNFTLYSTEIIENQFVIDKVYLIVETILMQSVYTKLRDVNLNDTAFLMIDRN
jgi:hypothetical protein